MFSFIQTASENLDGLIFNIWSLGSWFSMRSPAAENLNYLSYMSYLISRIYRDIYCYVPMFPRVISYVSSIDSKKTHFGVMKYSLSTLCRNYPCSISRYKRVISKMKVSEMNFQFIFTVLLLELVTTFATRSNAGERSRMILKYIGLTPWEKKFLRILYDRKRKYSKMYENSYFTCKNFVI